MVVDDLNVESIMSFPPKADAPLIVDSNAMLSDAFPLQGFQSVPRRCPKIVNLVCIVQHSEFPASDALDVLRQPTGDITAPDPLRLGAVKRPNHSDNTVPRY